MKLSVEVKSRWSFISCFVCCVSRHAGSDAATAPAVRIPISKRKLHTSTISHALVLFVHIFFVSFLFSLRFTSEISFFPLKACVCVWVQYKWTQTHAERLHFSTQFRVYYFWPTLKDSEKNSSPGVDRWKISLALTIKVCQCCASAGLLHKLLPHWIHLAKCTLEQVEFSISVLTQLTQTVEMRTTQQFIFCIFFVFRFSLLLLLLDVNKKFVAPRRDVGWLC